MRDEFLKHLHPVRRSLERGNCLELVIGPAPLTEKWNEELKDLLTQHPNRFVCYLLSEVPETHFWACRERSDKHNIRFLFISWLISLVGKEGDYVSSYSETISVKRISDEPETHNQILAAEAGSSATKDFYKARARATIVTLENIGLQTI